MKRFVIVLGTKNRHKVREMMAIYRRSNHPKLNIKFIPLYRFPHAPEVEETGRTYPANAARKALAWARYTGRPTLAEDSGIEVKALNWQPGLHSARFASNRKHKNASDTENVCKLLAKLSGLPQARRTARYRCSAVLASPSGKIIARAEGTCWGRIAMKPSGKNGFGYDPVFIPESRISNPESRIARTFGQLPTRLKHRISHRAIALRKIFKKISRFLDIS